MTSQNDSSNRDSETIVPCSKGRLLIVDDEPGIRNVFGHILSNGLPNCLIELAVNGAEAVAAFSAVHHALILMDLHMPVMDGETAFYKIRDFCAEQKWEMPAVVFCTGYDPSLNLRKIVSSSESHYLLRKPVANDVLIEILRARL
ncbi:MAG: response regulator [Lentisphaerae bacterium]|nr:response regulator [Lentisphaerota bacterium]